MKSLRHLYAILLLVAAGCVQEIEQLDPIVNPETGDNGADGTVTLTAVIDDDLTRTYLDSDNYVCWADGDEVWINGSTYTVSVSGNTATIPGVTTAAHYACVYPADAVAQSGVYRDGDVIKTDGDCSGIRVTLPQEQVINYKGGKQVLSLPMAAYGDGSDALQFKNLCGLMAVNISNTDKDAGIIVKTMTLSSCSSGLEGEFIAPLYGETWDPRNLSTTDYDVDWAVLASNIGSKESEEKRTISITVNDAPLIAKNSTGTFYVTVPVMDEGTQSRLMLRVDGNLYGGNHLVFEKISGSPKKIGRNQMGAVPVPSASFVEISTGAFNGSGTEADPYQISTPEQFNRFSENVRNGEDYQGVYFKQVQDIDFGGNPIGMVGYMVSYKNRSGLEKAFSGSYDGGGHKLSNFLLSQDDITIDGYDWQNYAWALFAMVDGGEIKHLTVERSQTLSTAAESFQRYAAGVVANMIGGRLEDVEFNGNLIFDNSENGLRYTSVGGIAGSVEGTTIKKARFNGSINTYPAITFYSGGVVGEVNEGSSLDSISVSASSVLSFYFGSTAGGICGRLINSSIKNSCFAGTMKYDSIGTEVSDIPRIGGIIGDFNINKAGFAVSNLTTAEGSKISFPNAVDCKGGGIFGSFCVKVDCTSSFTDITNNADISFNITAEHSHIGSGLFIDEIGGIIGAMAVSSYLPISRATNNGKISVSSKHKAYVGGIIGHTESYLNAPFTVTYVNTGDIALDTTSGSFASDDSQAGGLFGYLYLLDYDFTLQDCLNTGNVTCTSGGRCAYAGGFFGQFNGSGTITRVNKSVNTGAIWANSSGYEAYAGGMVGYDDDTGSNSTLQFFNCANVGSVKANAGAGQEAYAGGYLGYHDSNGKDSWCPGVINSVNLGDITAICEDGSQVIYIGGIIGYGCDFYTWIAATYSKCKLFGSRQYVQCGGLSGFYAGRTELSYWYSPGSESESNSLYPRAPIPSMDNVDAGNNSIPTVAQMNDKRDAVVNVEGYGAAFPDSPDLLEWEEGTDGLPVLKGLSY